MTRFFTSDTHFGHERIIELCNRPFGSVDEMNEALIANWNDMVTPEDTVFHLGDVALGPWTEWDGILSRLNGEKILVVGNHDRIFAGNSEKQQQKFIGAYNLWFDDYYDNIAGEFCLSNGQRVNLSHFPYDSDHTQDARFMDYRLPDDGTVLVHGHTHSNKKVSRSKSGSLQIHVGVDSWGYEPVSENQVIDLIASSI